MKKLKENGTSDMDLKLAIDELLHLKRELLNTNGTLGDVSIE